MIEEYFNIELRKRNSFAIDVVAHRMLGFDTVESLQEIFADDSVSNGQWAVLSGGNNILFTKDYTGTLIHPMSQGIYETGRDSLHVYVRAQAGVEWDDLVGWCTERELWGMENLSLIPGYAGAAPIQNIGAYGIEAKDVIESVEMYCTDSGKMLTLAGEHCAFGYRDSIFKRSLKGKVIITSVNFRLTTEPCPRLGYGDLKRAVEELGGASIENIRRAVIDIRRAKLPDPRELGNAGSFFKNPVVSQAVADGLKVAYPEIPVYATPEGDCKLAAGWLIDRAGWKGYRRNSVGVHKSQALVLVNYGGATGNDVITLAADIQADVNKKFGVNIEMEVNVW